MLALVCLVIIPMPIGTIRRALADVLLITPPDLKEHVDEVARTLTQRYGFTSHRSYVAKVGRGRQIELYFVAGPAGQPLEQWDRIRDEVSRAVGDDTPDRWLTIARRTWSGRSERRGRACVVLRRALCSGLVALMNANRGGQDAYRT